MTRLPHCIAALGLVAAACTAPALAQVRSAPAVQAAPATLEARIDEAFVAAFPMYEMARARYNAVSNPLNPAPRAPNGAPVNRRALIDHTARDVTTPNNDTLYSATWLELSRTPVRIRVPRIDGGRYWSMALLDIFTNNFAILGRQRDGDGPVDVTIVGPHWKGPVPKGRVIRAPSNDVQLVGRFLVNGPEDAPRVHAIQDALQIAPVLAGAQPVPQWVPVTTSTDPQNFLAVVNEMLSRNPLPPAERARYAAWSDLGLGQGADAFVRTSAAVQSAWRARLGPLHERLTVGLGYGGRVVQGWRVPSPAVGNFGREEFLRAAVAYGGLSALASTEAVYLNLDAAPDGTQLDGRRPWSLVVPPIQAGGFWSLSMYEKTSDGRLFFAANPLNRYSLGDRTPDVVRRADGSIEVRLQHAAPPDTRNWLPAPAGPFAITLRVYLPTDAMRRGEAPLPRLVPAD